jgi:hypothetical protein
MPMRTANNAVCEATVGAQEYVYSFGGLDSTKIYSGIHNRSFKYDVAAGTWSEIDSIPNTLPVIAAGASFVKNKIYVIGGYHVYNTGAEESSNEVHIYNPQTESWESHGAPVPIPIDDHVQCVYKDSLIFVVTGWSNSGNVPLVQIYDPQLDQWQSGTNTPNNAWFTAFGASGYILGDTVYYHGGASGGSFGARKYMRKGYIDPNDPTNITWTQMQDAPGDAGYRSACSGTANTIFWVGGSPTSYNYDGIAYNGSGGVEPSARILHFNNAVYEYVDQISQPYGVMDLRGIAEFNGDHWIICGGMDTNQVVSNRTFLLESNNVGLTSLNNNWTIQDKGSVILINTGLVNRAELINTSGQVVRSFDVSSTFEIKRDDFEDGIYMFKQGQITRRIRL